jgi:hypothetical protein
VDRAGSQKEEATGHVEGSSHGGYDQWQGRRLLFGLAACIAFVVLAIVYEKCG